MTDNGLPEVIESSLLLVEYGPLKLTRRRIDRTTGHPVPVDNGWSDRWYHHNGKTAVVYMKKVHRQKK